MNHAIFEKRKCAGGFTLLELCFGLLITAMVFGAVAGIATAFSKTWVATEGTQMLQAGSRQSIAQVERELRSAKFVGFASEGKSGDPARVVYWADDTPSGANMTGDGKMQVSEVRLIEHDASSDSLFLYKFVPNGSNAATGASELKKSDTDDATDAANFKRISGVTAQTLGRNVHEAKFKLKDAKKGGLPAVEYDLKYDVDGEEQHEHGTLTLRAPLPDPL